ncbi:MAG: PASTA domain-containing protein [Bacillaceae bacterium]|nr:PASTA domain-containing protein [Bacillaceae bacterium]
MTIPDNIIGMLYEEAHQTLSDLGLEVESEFTLHEEIEEGRVIRHTPGANRTVKKGSAIKLYVSEGRERVEMEDFTERTLDSVRRRLELQGFAIINEKPQETSEYHENIVIAQDPQPGMKVIPDETEVTIIYSTIPTVVLDDLSGWNLTAVNNYIQSKNLSVDMTEEQYSETVPKGQVIKQTPAAGSKVKVGTQLQLVISLGQEPVPEPEPISWINYMTVEVTEEQQLAGLSYEVRISYNDSTTVSFVNTVREEILQTKQYPIPLTVNPGEEAVVVLYINNEEIKRYVYTYEDAKRIANQ